jgi:hypothetical protein
LIPTKELPFLATHSFTNFLHEELVIFKPLSLYETRGGSQGSLVHALYFPDPDRGAMHHWRKVLIV